MRRFLVYHASLRCLTLAVCVAAALVFRPMAASHGSTLRVMTFNLKYDGGGNFDNEESWDSFFLSAPDDRRDRVVSVIDTFGPDVLGVQEMLTSQLTYLQNSAAMSDYGYYGVGRSDGANSGERGGIFYRNSRFTRLNQGEFWLSTTPETPGTTFQGRGNDTGNPRMATWVMLQDKQSPSQQYFIVNTHWSLDDLARQQSAVLIRTKIAELSGDAPTIVMGDFNEDLFATGYQALTGQHHPSEFQLIDAYVASGSPEGRTYHNWAGGVDGNRIDHILASLDFEAVSGSGNIVRTEFSSGYPSDHYPVTVQLTTVPEPSSLALLAVGALALLGFVGQRRAASSR